MWSYRIVIGRHSTKKTGAYNKTLFTFQPWYYISVATLSFEIIKFYSHPIIVVLLIPLSNVAKYLITHR